MLWHHPVFALHVPSHLGTYRLSSITDGFPTQRASNADRFPCYDIILSLHYTSPLTWVHTGCPPSPMDSPHKGPVMQTGFHVMTSSCLCTTHPLSPGYTQAVLHHLTEQCCPPAAAPLPGICKHIVDWNLNIHCSSPPILSGLVNSL